MGLLSSSLSISREAQAALIASALAKARARANQQQRDAARAYVPRGAAAVIQVATDDEVMLSGPAGTGKSRAWLEKINRLAWEFPRMRALIVRKTRVSLTQSTLVTFERHVLGEDNPICAGVQRENRHSYKYPNGSEIVTGGIDRPSRFMSTEFDLIYIPEASETEIDDWESLLSRLRNGVLPYQQICGDTNPDRADHWIVKRAQSGKMRMIESYHEDNPVLFGDDGVITERGRAYLARLDNLTGVRYQRLRLGKWVSAEGAVYEDWSAGVHLVDRFEIPPEWTRFRSIDFGYRNPFVCQWWAVSPDGMLILYREIYMSGRTVARHAETIKRLSENEKIRYTIADHDAEDRATLAEHGIVTQAAVKEVKRGIEKVQERLQVRNGKPGLVIFRDALVEMDEALNEAKKPLCTADEVGGYVWESKAAKEQPVKEDDHGLDALRYAVMSVDGGQGRKLSRVDNPFFD